MDLDEAAEVLYAGSPDDFVERRTALVAQARAERDRPLAKQIGALRRPTRTAWLINRLARDDADGVAALLALGTALEDAQRRRSGTDLRRLSAERRTLVDRLARDAVRRGLEAGYPAADTALQEVSQSLQAALGDPDTAEQLRRGRLTTAVSYGGFGPSDLMAAMAAALPGSNAAAGPPAPAAESEPPSTAEPVAEPVDQDLEDEAQRERTERAGAAEAAWLAATTALAEAQEAANAATGRADALADRVEELRAELAQAEADEAAARAEARTARRRHQEATRAVAEAQQARDDARTALER